MDPRFERLAAGRPLGWKGLFRLLSWRGLLMLALALALSVAIVVAAASVFLLVFPVLLLVGVVARLFVGKKPARTGGPASQPELIEGQFEIVEGPAVPPTSQSGWGPRSRP